MTRSPTIGALRHRVTLEAASRTDDGAGGAVVAWAPVLDAWAEITARTGGESLVADAVEARVTHVVRLRWREEIAPAMRWRFGTRLFEIRALLDADGTERWLDCLCVEADR